MVMATGDSKDKTRCNVSEKEDEFWKMILDLISKISTTPKTEFFLIRKLPNQPRSAVDANTPDLGCSTSDHYIRLPISPGVLNPARASVSQEKNAWKMLMPGPQPWLIKSESLRMESKDHFFFF